MAQDERARSADWFRRFAATEAEESPRYREWALAIADDAEILDRIVRLPVAKRQPVLVLTCIRVAGVSLKPFSAIRPDVVALWSRIASLARSHATQTNDPRRCSPLLVALDRIRGPIALIEVGASAGLTLIPDRYSYRWSLPGRTVTSNPDSGPGTIVLDAEVSGWGANSPRRPTIVYREGIDLRPLDVTIPADREWLEALVWPEQHERRELVRAAADIVAQEKPRLVAADALAEIRTAVSRARRAAPKSTVVISSPAVLVYLDPDERRAFERYCRRAKVRWISIDGRAVIPRIGAAADAAGLVGDYLLSLDGEPIAAVDPLGRRIVLASRHGLSAEQIDLIEFERSNWGPSRAKESLVRRVWDCTLVRYYQRVYGIMESTAARRYDPILVRSFQDANDERVRR